MRYPVIEFSQPAGDFLLTVLPAAEIIRISKATPRKFDSVLLDTVGGIQREPSWKRVEEITKYSETVDATFPTPILLAINSESFIIENNEIEIIGDKMADIVDGQHRILGLKDSNRVKEFSIPVVFIVDSTEEQKALIFATINGKQTKVPKSIIYDLFKVAEGRSPQKTAHEIARALNSDPSSSWYRRLKMLGKKTIDSKESLSQGTFVNNLIENISADPDKDFDLIRQNKEPIINDKLIFNDYFCRKQDSNILKILNNVFKAAEETWPTEWNDPNNYILTKTTGFSGIMRALPEMVFQGKRKKELTKEYFKKIFEIAKRQMAAQSIRLTSDSFISSARGEVQFKDILLRALRNE